MAEKSFEEQHAIAGEPWRYSDRGGERLRHLLTRKKIADMLGAKRDARLLEIGCSTANLSELLLPLIKELHCVDISETALKMAQKKLRPQCLPEQNIIFSQGNAIELPAESGKYDFVLCSDGIYTWNLSPEEKNKVLAEVERVLKPGGQALFADYLRPEWFGDAIGFFRQGPLEIQQVEYLGDRVWYKLENWLKAVRKIPPFQQIIRSLTIAQILRQVGLRMGEKGSNHIFVSAQKK